jgi:hypothetical protein
MLFVFFVELEGPLLVRVDGDRAYMIPIINADLFRI